MRVIELVREGLGAVVGEGVSEVVSEFLIKGGRGVDQVEWHGALFEVAVGQTLGGCSVAALYSCDRVMPRMTSSRGGSGWALACSGAGVASAAALRGVGRT